jgi:hypothetical protein
MTTRSFRLLALALAVVLAGCAASGRRYAEELADSAGIAPGYGRLTIFRTADSTLYWARTATVSIDGKEVGGCDFKGFASFDVPAGTRVLVVEIPDAPGKCRLSIEAEDGATHYFEIAPRLASYVASLPGALLGAVLPFGGVVAAIGMTAESSEKQCGGAFSIVPVAESVALSKLPDLRRSD